MLQRLLACLTIFSVPFLFTACSTTHYLYQAAKGQLELTTKAVPLIERIENPSTPPFQKKLLREISQIKSFGESQGLKATPNYEKFVQLDRPYVVWVVAASKPLEFKAKVWNFLLVGSFNYLGWFSEEDAVRFAKEIKSDEELDVYVRGASAYSTLGWFNDPILSTMISEDEDALVDLVNTVLHESVHATFFIKNQSYFNESLASFVADELTPIYLSDFFNQNPKIKKKYLEDLIKNKNYAEEFKKTYFELDSLYKSDLSDSDKLSRKEILFESLNQKLKIKRKLNNAFLIQYRTYGVGREDFEKLFQSCEHSIQRFLKKVMLLNGGSFERSNQDDFSQVIEKLNLGGC